MLVSLLLWEYHPHRCTFWRFFQLVSLAIQVYMCIQADLYWWYQNNYLLPKPPTTFNRKWDGETIRTMVPVANTLTICHSRLCTCALPYCSWQLYIWHGLLPTSITSCLARVTAVYSSQGKEPSSATTQMCQKPLIGYRRPECDKGRFYERSEWNQHKGEV